MATIGGDDAIRQDGRDGGCAVNPYRILCRWTDTGLAGDAMFRLFIVVPLWAAGLIASWWWPPGLVLGLGWIGFVLWRGTVLARTGYIGADAADIERAGDARPPAEDERRG